MVPEMSTSRFSSNLVQDIVNDDVSACATNASTAVDEDGSFGRLMLGLHSTVKPKNGRGIFRHSMIRPSSEVVLSGLQKLPASFDLNGNYEIK